MLLSGIVSTVLKVTLFCSFSFDVYEDVSRQQWNRSLS